MNIAKNLGNLISGLLAPQTPSPVRRTTRGLPQGYQEANRNPGADRTATGLQKKDRVTLSEASLAMASDVQPKEATPTDSTAAANSPPDLELLALPYQPSTERQESLQPNAESPLTRQLVRDIYGSRSSLNTRATSTGAARIDFHA